MSNLTQEDKITLYKSSNDKGKLILEQAFGKETFATTEITDRVKSLEDAIAIYKPDSETSALLKYNGTNDIMIGARSAAELFILAEVLNEGKEADWDNTDEPKWFPVFDMSSGGGFSYSSNGRWLAGSTVGSRLSFREERLSDYAAKIAPNSYKLFITKQHERK